MDINKLITDKLGFYYNGRNSSDFNTFSLRYTADITVNTINSFFGQIGLIGVHMGSRE